MTKRESNFWHSYGSQHIQFIRTIANNNTFVYVLLLLVDVGRVCELLELSGGFD
jgi:hypothetical protein